MTNDLEVKPEYPEPNLQQQDMGNKIFFAPIQPITAQSGTPSTGGPFSLTASDSAVFANLQTRVSDLEKALIKLGLLKHG